MSCGVCGVCGAQVFKNGKTVFFVASRGHHADIGGITPGSMPPFSHTLAEEGACIKSFKLVKDGVFQEEVRPIFLLSIFNQLLNIISFITVIINYIHNIIKIISS